MKYTIPTTNGTAIAQLQGTTDRQRLTWLLTLKAGSLELARLTITLAPKTMSEEYLSRWAANQSAEGFEANKAECQKLINLYC
ncbi:MAG: hypothetical protein AAGA46_00425 [Cyanobacteria bacterium P01_F01_bin.13]